MLVQQHVSLYTYSYSGNILQSMLCNILAMNMKNEVLKN